MSQARAGMGDSAASQPQEAEAETQAVQAAPVKEGREQNGGRVLLVR